MMYFEEGRRGHESKNADNPGKSKEIDSFLDPPEGMQLSQHLNLVLNDVTVCQIVCY